MVQTPSPKISWELAYPKAIGEDEFPFPFGGICIRWRLYPMTAFSGESLFFFLIESWKDVSAKIRIESW